MRYKNLILFVLLSMAWGSAFNFIKVGLGYFPPVLFASFRYLIAGVIMFVYSFFVNDNVVPRSKEGVLQVLVAGVFMIAIYHICLFIGEVFVSSSVASIIVSLSPVLTTGFVGFILPKERLDSLGVIGLFIGFLGVSFLLSPDLGEFFVIDRYRFLIFLAALSFALGSVLIRFLDSDLSIEVMEAWAMSLGAFLMFIVSFLLGESLGEVNLAIGGVFSLFYLGIFSSSIGFLIYFNLLQDLGPIEVNLVSYSAPVFASFIGIVFLNEEMSFSLIISLLLIFFGFVLLKKRGIKKEFENLI